VSLLPDDASQLGNATAALHVRGVGWRMSLDDRLDIESQRRSQWGKEEIGNTTWLACCRSECHISRSLPRQFRKCALTGTRQEECHSGGRTSDLAHSVPIPPCRLVGFSPRP